MKLTVDFETRSQVDLTKTSAYVYAESPTTDIICLAVKKDDGPTMLWMPDWSHQKIRMLNHGLCLISSAGLKLLITYADEIEAHNANFERALWRIMEERYGFDPIPLRKWRCSAARAARMALPRSLNEVGNALNLPVKKSAEGHALMLRMCKPRTPVKSEKEENPNWENEVYWHEAPLDILDLCRYCIQDVEAEHALGAVLEPLPPDAQELWFLDQEINDRGTLCDLALVDVLDGLMTQQKEALLAEFAALTEGAVTSVKQVARFKKWLEEKGIVTKSLDKEAVTGLMARSKLPAEVRRALEIRTELGPTSVDKIQAMLRCHNRDGRIRGGYVWHGASPGRWTGQGVQLHNLPRGTFADTEHVADTLLELGWPACSLLWDTALSAFTSTLVRSCLIAPSGKHLVAGDFSAVEGRILAWIAGEEHTLELYRTGEDPYKHAAASIYGIDVAQVTKAQRQVGKVAELALGYQGWVDAFRVMGTGYGVQVDEASATKIASAWRKARPRTVALWGGALQAVTHAIQNKHRAFEAGRCLFRCDNAWLYITLPSGRNLFYYRPHLMPVDRYGRTHIIPHFWGVDGKTKQWQVCQLHGGITVENIVQAIGVDLLIGAMIEVAPLYPIVMHTHDELVVEVDADAPESTLEEVLGYMTTTRPWACGCPIEAEGWRGRRFRK